MEIVALSMATIGLLVFIHDIYQNKKKRNNDNVEYLDLRRLNGNRDKTS